MMIQARGISKTYVQGGDSIPVLKTLSLDVEAGKSVAILGKSGSGKSTLLSILSGLDQPSEGTIQISGHELTLMDEEALAKFRLENLSIVFQQFHLMSGLSALENVSLPLEIAGESDAVQRARDALKRVGLDHRSKHFPSQLSGGEKQRVAIARAFVSHPKILLADEPSGSLDGETAEPVMNLLFDLVKSEKMTLVLVTHHDAWADKCDRTLKLVSGVLQ